MAAYQTEGAVPPDRNLGPPAGHSRPDVHLVEANVPNARDMRMAAWAAILRKNVKIWSVIVIYGFVGGLVYGSVEPQWTHVDVFYFIVQIRSPNIFLHG